MPRRRRHRHSTESIVTNHPAPAAPVAEMRDISITFPGVKALDGVDFRMFPGEVHSLMGENGAGKSTLIKALTGVYGIDAGTITLAGDEVSFTGPAQAQSAGISTVYQEVNLLPNLSVAENIMLGREPHRFGSRGRPGAGRGWPGPSTRSWAPARFPATTPSPCSSWSPSRGPSTCRRRCSSSTSPRRR